MGRRCATILGVGSKLHLLVKERMLLKLAKLRKDEALSVATLNLGAIKMLEEMYAACDYEEDPQDGFWQEVDRQVW
jgi:hypothetical protein